VRADSRANAATSIKSRRAFIDENKKSLGSRDIRKGQKRKCPGSRGASVLPSGADIVGLPRHVRLVPIGDMTPARSLRGGLLFALLAS
jgi:hypothetical protein